MLTPGQGTAAVFRCRPETGGVTDTDRDTDRMGLYSKHSFIFGIYFIQNKGENGTVPADMFIIISLQHTAHCRMRPHGEAEGGEWRLLQPTVLSLFSPPPAPPNVPRPACSHPRMGGYSLNLQQSLQAGQRRF